MPAEPRKPCYCLGLDTVRKVADLGELKTDLVDFVAASDLFKRQVVVAGVNQYTEIIAKILEVAQLTNESEEGGTVFMPDEEEWGEIVGLARRLAQ